jgi:hypothetical protein
MKTPKQKAVELIDKFTYWNTSEAEREGIKSALSCVDEIINELEDVTNFTGNKFSSKMLKYYREVKREINKINNL